MDGIKDEGDIELIQLLVGREITIRLNLDKIYCVRTFQVFYSEVSSVELSCTSSDCTCGGPSKEFCNSLLFAVDIRRNELSDDLEKRSDCAYGDTVTLSWLADISDVTVTEIALTEFQARGKLVWYHYHIKII